MTRGWMGMIGDGIPDDSDHGDPPREVLLDELDRLRAALAAAEAALEAANDVGDELQDQLTAARAELAAQGARLAALHDETRRERQVWRAEVVDAKAELAAVAGERDRVLAVLRKVEKRGPGGDCPCCRRFGIGERHYPDCDLAAALAAASLQPGEASERERYRAALLQVRVWTSTPKGLTDRKAQLATIKRIAIEALAPAPPQPEVS